MSDYPPSGCQHCGRRRLDHCGRWTDAAGWHKFEPPTKETIAERMRAKYAARLKAKGGQP